MSASAIVVDRVSKRFKLYHERPHTLKERVVRFRRPAYEEFWALRDVSLVVGSGETMGLIGPNGSGKTTLLRIVAGILRPDGGSVRTQGRVASLLELGAGFHPDLTGRENVYLNAAILGLSRKQTDRYFDEIVSFAELEPFIDTQVKHYSSGMYVRLGFAVAVHIEPDVLLVDEVLAVGDERFQKKCLERIRSFQKEGRTIVVVTHAVDLVKEICTRAAFLQCGRIEAEGQPAEVVRAFREALGGGGRGEAAEGEGQGSREVRIVEVRVRDGSGKGREVFVPGEDAEVVVELEADGPVCRPVVECWVYDDADRVCFGTSTEELGLALGTVQGKVKVVFRFLKLPVLDGRHDVGVRVLSKEEGKVYDVVERKCVFWVKGEKEAVGHVMVPAEVSVQET